MFACKRCQKNETQLTKKPLGGKLGQLIVDHVCQACWQEWDALQLKIINEYRLNLSIPQHYDVLVQEMLNFLHLNDNATGTMRLTIQDDRTH